MNFDIKVRNSAIFLRLLTRSTDGQLHRLVTSGSVDLSVGLSDEMLDALYDGKAMEIPLPLNNWRRVLARLSRFHDWMRDPANQARFLAPLSPEQQVTFDTSPLTFSVDGVVYDSPRAIPGPADITVPLGTFELTTSTVLLTDPCYEKGTWCTGELEARTGTWNAQVLLRDDKGGGHRNAMLSMAHVSVSLESLEPSSMEKTDIDVGVDSGQAGLFEKIRFPDDKAQLDSNEGTWYSSVCEITGNETGTGAGIAPGGFGVVSQTFWGDGGYPCFVRKDESGQVVAVVLVFDGSMNKDDDEAEGDDAA